MDNIIEVSEDILSKIKKYPEYNQYHKLEEAIHKNELYDYLSSSPHYRCDPEKGMDSVNDFRMVVENINCFLFCHPEYISAFQRTMIDILTNGNFYEVFSVLNIMRKQFGLQFHKITPILLVTDDMFLLIRKAISKFENEFLNCHRFTTAENGMMHFFESWNEFLCNNTDLYIL